MSQTKARTGFGTLFQVGNGATPTETFTTVANVVNISGPEEIREMVDGTHMESTEGVRERIPSLRDFGVISLDVDFAAGDSSQANVRTDLKNGTLRNFRIIFPGSGKRFEGAGYVSKIGLSTPLDNKMVSPIEITPSGPWNIVNHP